MIESKKISELNEQLVIGDTDLFAVVSGGETKKATKANILADVTDSINSINTSLSGKENTGVAQGLIDQHEIDFNHALIATALQPADLPTNLSSFVNDLGNYGGWITGIDSQDVIDALGFTPIQLSDIPSNLSEFNNDLGNYGGWITGVSIGDSIGTGTPNSVLYLDGSSQLAQSTNLTFDGSLLTAKSLNVSDLDGYQLNGDTVIDTSIATTLKIGPNAGSGATGTGGVFIGDNVTNGALSVGTGGINNNIVIGDLNTGASLTTSLGNVIIGSNAGNKLTTGLTNVFIGQNAGELNETGENNFAMGNNAFRNPTGAGNSGNLAIGASAMRLGGLYINSVALGGGALYGKAGGSTIRGIAIGPNAMGGGNNSGDIDNIGIGFQAGNNITSGDNNVMIGLQSSFSITTGTNNTNLGRQTGYLNTTGSEMVNIGNRAGRNSVGISSGINIGSNAGRYNQSSNRLIIDNQDRTDAATEIIESIIYGIMDSTPSSQFLTFNSNVTVRHSLSTIPEEITATSEGVAASLTTESTEVTTNGDADLDNVTLANGTSGQMKSIYCVALGNPGDTWKITPATMVGGTQITFTGAGQGCTLRYADSEGWVVVGNNGGTIT